MPLTMERQTTVRNTLRGSRTRSRMTENIDKVTRTEENLALLCKSICRPLSVSVCRLTSLEVRTLLRSKQRKTKCIPKKTLPTVKRQSNRKKQQGKSTEVLDQHNLEVDAGSHVGRTSDKQILVNGVTTRKASSVKMKEVVVKLNSIDTVINKIPQSFTKVASKSVIIAQTLRVNRATRSEEHGTLLFETNSNNQDGRSNHNDSECSTICTSRSNVTHSNEDDTNNVIDTTFTAKGIDESNNSGEWKFRRKRKISDNEDVDRLIQPKSKNLRRTSSRNSKVKRHEESFPELSNTESGESNETEGEDKVTKKKSLRRMPRVTSIQKLNSFTKVRFSSRKLNSMNGNTDVPQPSIRRSKQSCTISNCQDSNQNVEEHVANTEDFGSGPESSVKNRITSSVTENNEPNMCGVLSQNIQSRRQMEQLYLDRALLGKYKIFKELKVFVIKLEDIETSHNLYSASEIEYLSKKYVDLVLNTNFRYPVLLPSSDSFTNEWKLGDTIESQEVNAQNSSTTITESSVLSPYIKESIDLDETILLDKSIESYPSAPDTNIPENQNTNICTPVKFSCNQTEVSSNTYKSSPVSLSSIKTQEKMCLKNQKISRNFTEVFQDTLPSVPVENLTHGASEDAPELSDGLQEPLSFSSETALGQQATDEECDIQNSVCMQDSKQPDVNASSSIKCKSSESVTSIAREVVVRENLITNQGETNVVSEKDIRSDETSSEADISDTVRKVISDPKECVENSNASNVPKEGATESSTLTCETSIAKTKWKEHHAVHKCIPCGLSFEDFSILQEHITTHTQKSPDSSSNLTSTSDGTGKMNKFHSSKKSSSSKLKIRKTFCQSSMQEDSSSRSKKSPVLARYIRDGSTKKRQKSRKIPAANESNVCAVCSKSFNSKMDLSTHIYSHTEFQLQEIYEMALKEKEISTATNKTVSDKSCESHRKTVLTEQAAGKESMKENTEGFLIATEKRTDESLPSINEMEAKKLVEIQLTEEEESVVTKSTSLNKSNSNSESPSVPMNFEATTGKSKETTRVEDPTSNKPTATHEIEPEKTNSPSRPTNTVVQVTKPIQECQCHKAKVPDEKNLKIEIALLCHICRVLFHSMECFETHYRLPESTHCNRNRSNGRYAKLFCTNCTMIFSSVQDVRQHLEMHARFEQSHTIDFRCNICKVIFVGIGSLFYVHWSHHMKNPFFVASRLSFPKNSVIVPKTNIGTANASTETYLQVAEYICHKCKIPFSTERDLKKHESTCKNCNNTNSSEVDNAVITTVANTVPKVRLLCGLCDKVFFERTTFQKHIKDKHHEQPGPQYIRVSCTAFQVALICIICMKVSKNKTEFEEHRMQHTIEREYFICMHCKKNCDNLESFIDHAKEQHSFETREDGPCCKVVYRDIEYSCYNCNMFFESQQAQMEHFKSRNMKSHMGRCEIKENPCSRRKSVEENVTLTAKPKESSTTQHSKEKKNEKSSSNSMESTTQKVITLTDNEDDDSEHELMIDFIETEQEHSADHQQGSEKETQNVTKPASNVPFITNTSGSVKSTATTISLTTASSNSTVTSTTSFTASSITLITASNTASILRSTAAQSTAAITPKYTVTTPTLQKSVEKPKIISVKQTILNPTQVPAPSNNVTSTATLPVNAPSSKSSKSSTVIKEEVLPTKSTGLNDATKVNSLVNDQGSVISKKCSPPRPRKGFLRVKTLAELTGKNVHVCSNCGLTLDSVLALSQHSLLHLPEGKRLEDVSRNNVTLQSGTIPTGKNNSTIRIAHKETVPGNQTRQTVFVINVGRPISSTISNNVSNSSEPTKSTTHTPPSTASNNIPKTANFYTTSNDRQGIRTQLWHANPTEAAPSATTQNSTLGYHKNLPQCNYTRQKTALPRSAQRNDKNIPVRTSSIVVSNQPVNSCSTNGDYINNAAQPSSNFISTTTSTSKDTNHPSSCDTIVYKKDENAYECLVCTHFRANTKSEFVAHMATPYHMNRVKQHIQQESYQQSVQNSVNDSNVTTSTEGTNRNENNLTNNNQNVGNVVQVTSSSPVITNISAPVYYQPSFMTSSGVTHLISNPTTTVPSISVVNEIQQQQPVYQPQFYTQPIVYTQEPHLQQQQNVLDLSHSSSTNKVISNRYQVPVQENIRTYERPPPTSVFLCPHCITPTIFRTESLLQLHINANHNYVCDICRLQLFNYNDFNIHRIEHELLWEANKFQNRSNS